MKHIKLHTFKFKSLLLRQKIGQTNRSALFFLLSSKGFELSTRRLTGKDIEPERTRRVSKRGRDGRRKGVSDTRHRERGRDNYFDEWNAKHFQISPSPPKIKDTQRGVFHKAALTCRKKEYGRFLRTPFTRLTLQGIVCYTFVFRVVIGEVFADTKVKLLRSEVCAKLLCNFYALSGVKLAHFASGKTSLSEG